MRLGSFLQPKTGFEYFTYTGYNIFDDVSIGNYI